jgi:hypothetical protein
MILGARLQGAPFVPQSGFIRVLIRNEDFDAREMAIESIEKAMALLFNRSGERYVHGDIFVAINQDLHGSIS